VIRLTVPSIDEDDLRAVREVLLSGYLVQGPRVAAFEQAVAAYVGTEHAVAVSSCTAALHLALLAVGVGAGDKVAVPTYSWPSTANVVALCGAEPVFVEIDAETSNMDPAALEITLQHNQVKAVIVVHIFGGMAAMPRILEIANRSAVPVIEDAACALGAELGGRKAGAFGATGCFSFHPRKVVTTGEGGVLTTNNADLARTVRTLRNHGIDPDAPSPDFITPGFNLRLTEFQAALGITQLTKLDRIVENRRAAARVYDSLLAPTGITPPRALKNSRHAYQSYAALLPRGAAPRGKIIAALKERGFETTIGTYHIPLTTYFARRGGYSAGNFPVTDDIAQRHISLPLFEGITLEQQQEIVSALCELLHDPEECGFSAVAAGTRAVSNPGCERPRI
jgi:dTDP-4-amino-4,6-dideoxygalactose transaminase